MPDSAPSSLQRIQYAFAAYIRDPHRHPLPPGVSSRRMEMYRELFFNNIEDFLSGCFPVLQRILGDERWSALTQDFYARHRCRTPIFAEIPEEFLDFLNDELGDVSAYPPFLHELAHYEWIEVAVARSEGQAPRTDPAWQDDPMSHAVGLSELACLLAYRYPVHKISLDYQPQQAPEHPTYLVVYRNNEDEVKFVEITGVTYRLLQLLDETAGMVAGDAIQRIAEELNYPDPTLLRAPGEAILRDLATRGIVYRLA